MINQQRAGQWMTHGNLMNIMHKMDTMEMYCKCRYSPCTWSPVAWFNYVWQSTPMPACCPPEVACRQCCYSIITKTLFGLGHFLLIWLIIFLQKCWTWLGQNNKYIVSFWWSMGVLLIWMLFRRSIFWLVQSSLSPFFKDIWIGQSWPQPDYVTTLL